ncbi:MAG TPA: hypothetical protein VM432_06590 [Bdellovibrionales bacterium]|jgi:hypothetical protein|nr:hypothetical protein [Bdellovibrionales bacterium]
MSKHFLTVDSFSDDAKALRSHFEERFEDPRAGRSDRFVWDYWHVPGQYTSLRTPAYHFFPKKIYDRFHNHLVWWGRRNLGCHDVSPPWMSCYLDGFGQELHGDLPHGPWAYVYSLTPWKKRKFRGGETILLKEEILNYWQDFRSVRGLEREDILAAVPAEFNRLTVFDPRIPHGVRTVEGVRDLLEGRLVIHGWFVQPRPFIEGPLPPKELQSVIDDLGGEIGNLLEQGLELSGMVSLRVDVSPAGNVTDVATLTHSLRHPGGDKRIAPALLKHVHKYLLAVKFSKRKGKTRITLPLIFETH